MFHLNARFLLLPKKPFLPILLGVFLLVASFFAITQTVHAADPKPIGGGCVGIGVSIGLKSPFSTTPDMCLGDEGSSNRRFFQFAVKLEKTVAVKSVTAKSGGGATISFVKQSDTLYVSTPDADKLGFAGFVLPSSSCNTTDPSNLITITTVGPSNTDTKEINLCSYASGNASDKSLIYVTADTLKDESGNATASTGTIKGNLGIKRTNETVAKKWREGKLEKDGVMKFELTGGPTVIKGDNGTKGYSLSDGILTIPDLKPGTYTLKIVYNDKPGFEKLGGMAEATGSDIPYDFAKILVRAGEETWIGNSSKSKVFYVNSDGIAAPEDKQEDSDVTSSCALEGVGWVVCPLVTFMGTISDQAYSVIENFLKVNLQLIDTKSGTYIAWSSFRNIANVAFVIVFIVIIYSQLTGMGVSNYGVKKTLPRLVVAVILVNISFYICQLAVDVTQIIGGSLNNFLQNIPVSSTVKKAEVITWTEALGDILSGTGIVAVLAVAAVGTAAAIALSVSGPVLLAFLIAVLMTVIILIGRQAAVVILIVLSPLAFVAYLLPNTQNLFRKWYKMFVALLMVYPIISVLYGGGALAAKILSNAAGSGTKDSFWLGITALGVSAIPLIMTPASLKGALNATGSIGAKLSKVAGSSNSRIRSSAMKSSRLGEATQGIKNRFALSGAQRRGNSNLQRRVDNSRLGRALGLDKGAARAIRAVNQEENAEVEAAEAQILSQIPAHNRTAERGNGGVQDVLEAAIASGDTARARAAQKILLNSGAPGLARLQNTYSTQSVADHMGQHEELTGALKSDVASAGIKGKNNALSSWSYNRRHDALVPDSEGNSLANHANTVQRLNPVELAGQSLDNLRSGQAHINAVNAQAVLDNANASALLDGDKRQFFTDIANSSRAQAAAAVVPAAAATPGAQPSAPQPATRTATSTEPTSTPNEAVQTPQSGGQGELDIHGRAPRTPNSDAGD